MEILDRVYFIIPNWKWLALVAGLILLWVLRPAIQMFAARFKKIVQTWQTESSRFISHFLTLEIERPLGGLITFGLAQVLIDALTLPEKLTKYLFALVSLGMAFYAIYLCYLAVDAVGMKVRDWAEKTPGTMDDQLVPFATKSLKVLVVVLGVLVFLQNMGFNVVSLLAGLSLGGLALALAAQETFANLFGSITIFFDNPFKVGDHIKVGDSEGIVEDIGFRSTRLRSFYNSLITIPNSVVAKEKIDNLGVRPARRVRFVLGLEYGTSIEKIEKFCDHLAYFLKNSEKIDPSTVSVHFSGLGSTSLDVIVIFHINTSEISIEFSETQKVNLEIIKIAKESGVEFAFPTQTVYFRNQVIQ